MSGDIRSCSFCDKPFDACPVVVAHRGHFICSDCISDCVGVMAKALVDRAKTLTLVPTPNPNSRTGE